MAAASLNDAEQRNGQLCEWAERGDVAGVKRLLSQGGGLDLNYLVFGNWSALMAAAVCNHHDVITVLLRAGADPNVSNPYGDTALIMGSSHGSYQAVARLLQWPGVALDLADGIGKTALKWAQEKGHTNIVEELHQAAEARQLEVGSGEEPRITTPSDPTAMLSAPLLLRQPSMPGHEGGGQASAQDEVHRMREVLAEKCRELEEEKRLRREVEASLASLRISGMQQHDPRNCYPTSDNHRGLVIIIANSNFRSGDKRWGIGADIARLSEVFGDRTYSVVMHYNFTAQKISTTLANLATASDYECYSSIFFIVLTHGKHTGILGTDEIVVPDTIFVDTLGKSQSLSGKPKVVIVQSCRGGEENEVVGEGEPASAAAVSRQVSLATDGSQLAKGYDMTIAHSTIPYHVSYRHVEKGSFFIQILCDVIEQHADTHHLQDLLLMVNSKMADKVSEGVVQCPSIWHNSMRKHFFL